METMTPTQSRIMTRLVIKRGPDAGRQFPLAPDCTLVGRQPDAAIYLPPKAVSRQHAHILCEDGQFFVEDLESANGTFLNGKRLAPHMRVPLTDKDHLQIGPYEM